MVVSANDYIKHTQFQNPENFYRICVKNVFLAVMQPIRTAAE